MKKILILILIIFSIIYISGCATIGTWIKETPSQISSKSIGEKGDLYTIPASLRTLDIRKSKLKDGYNQADYIVCSEPVPDVALSSAVKLGIDVSKSRAVDTASKSLVAKGNIDASKTALALAGRTQIVLLAREFISSNCRAMANGWISITEFKLLHGKVIEQISNMIAVEKAKEDVKKAKEDVKKAKAEAEKAKAEAEKAKAEAEKAKKINETAKKSGEIYKEMMLLSCADKYSKCLKETASDEKKIAKCGKDFQQCSAF